jgi:Protein of unknown function (DUF4239)
MVLWIESQPTPLIALLVFAFGYLLAAVIFLAVAAFSRCRVAVDLKGLTPVVLTPLAVIVGLLIAFLASRVWSNFDRATASLADEASAIREAILLTETLPVDTRTAVAAAIKTYVDFVETDDWPAMARGEASLRRIPPGLRDAMTALLSFNPAAAGQRIAQERAVGAIEQALEARRHRIVLSQTIISPTQWQVIVLLSALGLLTIAIVHVEHRVTAAVGMAIFSTAIAACLVLLMVHDRPFAAGGITLQPNSLREVGAAVEPPRQ